MCNLSLLLIVSCLTEASPIPPQLPMVQISSGTFTMGRLDTGLDATGGDDELPRHDVWLDAYEIGQHEVTNEAFATVYNWAISQGKVQATEIDQSGIRKGDKVLLDLRTQQSMLRVEQGQLLMHPLAGQPPEKFPVTFVSWYGAVAFCQWLSEWQGQPGCYDLERWECVTRESGGYRLPSEAEWERAAGWDPTRGAHLVHAFAAEPSALVMNFYDSERTIYANPARLGIMPFLNPAGWFDGIRAQRAASPAGCEDMSGNLWEWCGDWYAAGYYAESPTRNPVGPVSGTQRVERGGSWRSPAQHCRTAKRNYDVPTLATWDLGFRVARSVREATPGRAAEVSTPAPK